MHCAARMGYWSRQNEEQRRINVEGSSALYRAAGKRGIARVVHVSTVGAVGARRSPTPMNENEPWAGQARPRAMYFTSKREAEERALAAAKGGLELCVVNPGGMHGARADGEPAGGMVAAVLAGKVGRVPPGGGTMARADDVARGCLAALERGERGRRYLLGGHNRTWLAIHESIASLAGLPASFPVHSAAKGRLFAAGATLLDLVRLSRPPWAPERYRIWGWYGYADSSRARAELGYEIAPFAEALATSIAEQRAATGTEHALRS